MLKPALRLVLVSLFIGANFSIASISVAQTTAAPAPVAQASPAPTPNEDTYTTRPLRIAFVDIDRVTADSPSINRLMDSVEADVSKEQAKFEQKKLAFDTLRREIQQKETILSAEAIAEKRTELEKLRSEIEDMQYEVKKIMDQSQRRVVEPAMDLISEAIRQVGKDYEYDLILRGEVVLHGSRRVDITKLVVWQIEEIAKAKRMQP